MSAEVWVLGATGRVGRRVAQHVAATGRPVVLVGRDRGRLEALGISGDVRVLEADTPRALAAIAQAGPAVVVNTVGPFLETAGPVLDACPPGTHYVDVGNEPDALQEVLDRHDALVATGRTAVGCAGFGVLGTQAALGAALAGQEARGVPSRVRIDAIAALAGEEGRLGEALARTIVRGFSAAAALGREPERVRTPDGDSVVTGTLPSGELLAAARLSRTDNVTAASVFVPTGVPAGVLRALAPVLATRPVARVAGRALARVRTKAGPRPRAHTWARARVEWPDGTTRTAWLRAEEAMDFTVAAATEVTLRLAAGDGRPGAFTPVELFGTGLAEAAGAVLING
ncbi:saccharopine dehydrogenase NADP-binding domain-containing protein [Kineococcus sp. GCM10028916]|uniref:saccharopine dehydrogenase NADP-binding domain-containing protein n=1 Tax=Kineococcus sp. GCM10028916 TaxID=3273394 RepID=UPI00362B7BD8